MVAATNETGFGGASVLGGEVWVLVGWNKTSTLCTTSIHTTALTGPFGRLDVGP